MVYASGSPTGYLSSERGNMNSKALQAALASYARTAVSAVLAMYLAGNTDAKALSSAALAAVAGPLLRALNPKDSAFGLGASK
jgi:hypothetical protein